jgi:hypothetical protein
VVFFFSSVSFYCLLLPYAMYHRIRWTADLCLAFCNRRNSWATLQRSQMFVIVNLSLKKKDLLSVLPYYCRVIAISSQTWTTTMRYSGCLYSGMDLGLTLRILDVVWRHHCWHWFSFIVLLMFVAE